MSTAKKIVEVKWKWNTVKYNMFRSTNLHYASTLQAQLWSIDDDIIDVEWEVYIKLPKKQRVNYDDAILNKKLLDISAKIDTLEKNMVIELLKGN